jgi:hypothetical protein
MFSLLALFCALTLAQPPDPADWQAAPRLAAGLELTYSGTYLEEDLDPPNVHYQRRYRLDTVLFVLDSRPASWDVALLTTLSLRASDADNAKKTDQSSSVRLELTNIDKLGRLTLELPLSGPPTLECGMVLEVPSAKMSPGQFWEVSEEGRPPRSWQVVGPEPCNGAVCLKLVGTQQSDDWDRPRGDHTAWRRRDTVWIRPSLGVAQKVERVVERRLPARRDPSHRATVSYELESPFQYRPGRLFEDRRQEVLKAKKFQDDARPVLAQPSQRRQEIESLLHKIAIYTQSQPPTLPYRKAVLHLQSRLEAARRGETPPEAPLEERAASTAVQLGQRVPDFIATDLTGKESARLGRLLGRPVFLFFYNPATGTGGDLLRFALMLHQKHGDHLSIMALAVTDDPQLARKQHAELSLPFAVLDGRGLHTTFGVDATPRLVILDGDGVLRYAATGWGTHTPREVNDELTRCLPK